MQILIYGKINGSVNATGSVRTAKGSHIQGNIESKDANISGNVEGHVNIENKTVLEKDCVLNGDLSNTSTRVAWGNIIIGLFELLVCFFIWSEKPKLSLEILFLLGLNQSQ